MSCRRVGVRFVRFFFFFQAEDGIRDVAVTGVQSVLFRSRTPTRFLCTDRVNVHGISNITLALSSSFFDFMKLSCVQGWFWLEMRPAAGHGRALLEQSGKEV